MGQVFLMKLQEAELVDLEHERIFSGISNTPDRVRLLE